jgi:hypothetical protein
VADRRSSHGVLLEGNCPSVRDKELDVSKATPDTEMIAA